MGERGLDRPDSKKRIQKNAVFRERQRVKDGRRREEMWVENQSVWPWQLGTRKVPAGIGGHWCQSCHERAKHPRDTGRS